MDRLSEKYNILFIEEPDSPGTEFAEGSFQVREVKENLSVFTPLLEWDGWQMMCPRYVRLLTAYLATPDDALFWFYSPFYVHLLNELNPSFIVYDCMDELAAFRNASPNLPQYEKQLMAAADVIFTGGRSLYEARKDLRPDVYCFPSSVDAAHFARAFSDENPLPDDLARLKKPVAAYYGVIDERIDFELLMNVASRMPEVSFAMIGPFAKIQEEDAASARNIYYLGKKDYGTLPAYLRGVDVALMPFAINASTRFISPTKTLEYMAAGRPVVSTPVHDVVRDYGDVAGIAGDAAGFAGMIERFLNETPDEKARRVARQRAVVENTSWEKTVCAMEELIAEKKRSSGTALLPSRDPRMLY